MAVKEEPKAVPENQEDLTLHRAERFSELGFGHDDSFVLAITRRADGFYLYWGDVSKALNAGATHEQIVDWFTYPTELELQEA